MIEPQIITRDGEPEYVVIPIADWHRIREMLDELEDIRDLDAALAKPDRRMVPFEVTSAILDGASPIRAWREHRGLTQRALAEAAGIAAPYLSQLEAGRRRGTAAVLRKLAGVLGAEVDDLIEDDGRSP
jgi:DNA-binding XRE family transcriptional regulator